MTGLEKLIIDLSQVTCPQENGLYQEQYPCQKNTPDGINQTCIACWSYALMIDVPETKTTPTQFE